MTATRNADILLGFLPGFWESETNVPPMIHGGTGARASN